MCMLKKLTLSSDDIFNKEFTLQYKGYVPQEVDDFLDEVLKFLAFPLLFYSFQLC